MNRHDLIESQRRLAEESERRRSAREAYKEQKKRSEEDHILEVEKNEKHIRELTLERQEVDRELARAKAKKERLTRRGPIEPPLSTSSAAVCTPLGLEVATPSFVTVSGEKIGLLRHVTSKTPAPKTPAPKTPAPKTPAPKTPAPKTPAPKTPAPKTPTGPGRSSTTPTVRSYRGATPARKVHHSEMSTPVQARKLFNSLKFFKKSAGGKRRGTGDTKATPATL